MDCRFKSVQMFKWFWLRSCCGQSFARWYPHKYIYIFSFCGTSELLDQLAKFMLGGAGEGGERIRRDGLVSHSIGVLTPLSLYLVLSWEPNLLMTTKIAQTFNMNLIPIHAVKSVTWYEKQQFTITWHMRKTDFNRIMPYIPAWNSFAS